MLFRCSSTLLATHSRTCAAFTLKSLLKQLSSSVLDSKFDVFVLQALMLALSTPSPLPRKPSSSQLRKSRPFVMQTALQGC